MEKHYIINFTLLSKPIYKRKQEILENMDNLKKQLKKEGFKGKEYSLNNVTCFASDHNRAKCVLSVDEPVRDKIEWLPDRINTYNAIMNSEGDYNKIGKNYNVKHRQDEIKKEIHSRFNEEEFKEKYKEIKSLEFAKTAHVDDIFLSPFKVTPKHLEEEKEWIEAIDHIDLDAETANKLYNILRT